MMEEWLPYLDKINQRPIVHLSQVGQNIYPNYPFSLNIFYKLLGASYYKEHGGRFYGRHPKTGQLLFLGNPTAPFIDIHMNQFVQLGHSELLFINELNVLQKVTCTYEILAPADIKALYGDQIYENLSTSHAQNSDVQNLVYYFQQSPEGGDYFKSKSSRDVYDLPGTLVALIRITEPRGFETDKANYQGRLRLSALTELKKKPVQEILGVDFLPVHVNKIDINSVLNSSFSVASDTPSEAFSKDNDPKAMTLLNKLITFCHDLIESTAEEKRDSLEIEKQLIVAARKVLRASLGEDSLLEISTYHRNTHLLMVTDYESKDARAQWSGPELMQTREEMLLGNIIYVGKAHDKESLIKAHSYYYNVKQYMPAERERDVVGKVKALLYYNTRHQNRKTASHINVPLRCFNVIIGHIHATNVKPGQVRFLNALSVILSTAYEATKAIHRLNLKEYLRAEDVSLAGIRISSNAPAFNFLEEDAVIRARFLLPEMNNISFATDVRVTHKEIKQSKRKDTTIDFAWTLNKQNQAIISELLSSS